MVSLVRQRQETPMSPVTETPDLSTYFQIHRAMRESAARLHQGVDRLARGDRPRAAAVLAWFDGFAGEIRTHHTVEDDIFFPALAERVPTYADLGAGLDADHVRLEELLNVLTVELRRLAGDGDWLPTRAAVLELTAELRNHLDEHLGVEDSDVLPLFERHFTAAEYEAMHQQAMKSNSIRQLAFTVPWLCSHLDDEERSAVLASAPLPLKVLWWTTRGRYARRTDHALGAPLSTVAA
jgi:iron-sulfur cluster repair protein YtfE (RIC family)